MRPDARRVWWRGTALAGIRAAPASWLGKHWQGLHASAPPQSGRGTQPAPAMRRHCAAAPRAAAVARGAVSAVPGLG